MWADKNYRVLSLIVTFLFLLLYIFGANANSSLDAWGYAAQIVRGDELFQPHHLLYSFIGYLWVSFVNLFFEFDTLLLLKVLNAIFASAILYVLSILLKTLSPNNKTNIFLLLLVGSSWGIMRFATENETYIIPLFFSLLGSYFFSANKSLKYIVLAGFFAALATLFHQIMVFWWLGLFLGVVSQRKAKNTILYTLPALIVPFVYAVVTYSKYGTISIDLLIRFIFSDYFSGAASIELGGKSLLLLFISIIRSFVQVHGYIFNIENFWIAGLFCGALLVYGFYRFFDSIRTINILPTSTFWVHLSIIGFQIVFACLSGGNAEFLVMIPVLLIILISFYNNLNSSSILFVAIGILTWNISFGIIPMKFHRLDGSEMVVKHICENEKQNKSVYLLHNLPRIQNELDYKCFKESPILVKSNILLKSEGRDSLSNLLKQGFIIYTDSYNRPNTLSRESIVSGETKTNVFDGYKKMLTDSVSTITGVYYLYSLK